MAAAEGFENEPLMLKDSLKSLISSVPYDLGRPRALSGAVSCRLRFRIESLRFCLSTIATGLRRRVVDFTHYESRSVLVRGRRVNRTWFCRATIGIRASKQQSFHRYRSSCSWKPENRGSLVFPGDPHANNCSIDDHGIPLRLCERDSEPTGLPAK